MNIRSNPYHYKQKARKSHGKRFKSLLLVSIIVLATFTITTISSSDPTENQDKVLSESAVTVDLPDIPSPLIAVDFPVDTLAAIGTLDDGFIASNVENESPVPIASLTKMITALAILEVAPIQPGQKGDTITLNEKDEQYYRDYVAKDGTVSLVVAGQQMSQFEALQAILLPSANNMADSLVDRYFSSQEEYLQYANSMLQRFGLDKTIVADASGFSPSSVSTPSNMIEIAKRSLQNPIIAEIVAQPSATISVAGEIPNYNPIITDEGVTGLKPGFTEEAGLCLLFSAKAVDSEGNSRVILGVILGANNRNTSVEGSRAMIDQSRKLLEEL